MAEKQTTQHFQDQQALQFPYAAVSVPNVYLQNQYNQQFHLQNPYMQQFPQYQFAPLARANTSVLSNHEDDFDEDDEGKETAEDAVNLSFLLVEERQRDPNG